MMDAEILAVTMKGKNTMSKRRALRLLLSAPAGEYELIARVNGIMVRTTQNKALDIMFETVLLNDGSNLTPAQNEGVLRIKDSQREDYIDEDDY